MCDDPIKYLNRLVYERGGRRSTKRWQAYFEVIPELSEDLPIPLLGIMILIWQLRERDLQLRYKLDSTESKLDFLAWCVVHGVREYASLRQAPIFTAALKQPAYIVDDDDAGGAISWKMLLIARARSDLGFDLVSPQGRAQFVLWYLLHGRLEMGGGNENLEGWQISFLLASSIHNSELTRLQSLVYDARPDVQEAFPLQNSLAEYKGWFDGFLNEEVGLREICKQEAGLQGNLKGKATRVDGYIQREFGVNVIGYAYAQTGIGEDARMAVKSLLKADVPSVLVNFPPGNDTPQSDVSLSCQVSPFGCYRVNLFCITGIEHGRYLATEGVAHIDSTFNIGYWPWELAQWPEEWLHLLSLVDEIWVSSRHIYDSLAPVSLVPVKIAPMAVELAEKISPKRSSFSLPENTYLFFFAFDLSSSMARKNPWACIDAFKKAFPGSNDDVGIVIKAHAPNVPHDEWNKLMKVQEEDPRIFIFSKTMDKKELHDLYGSCDCFISLHRSEGFGRNIAEAMLLNKPVIVTGYSGNLMYSRPNSSFLVRYRAEKISDGDYAMGKGQAWADPDTQHAAGHMQYIVKNPDAASKKGIAGGDVIRSEHNCKTVGVYYKKLLTDALQLRLK